MHLKLKLVWHGPTSGTAVTVKTGRREVLGSSTGRACRPNRFVVFSENCINTGQDHLERPLRRALHLQAQVPSETIGLNTNNQSTNWHHQDHFDFRYHFFDDLIYLLVTPKKLQKFCSFKSILGLQTILFFICNSAKCST